MTYRSAEDVRDACALSVATSSSAKTLRARSSSSRASLTPDPDSHATASKTSSKRQKSTYLEEKEQNIAKNNALLAELGLLGGFGDLMGVEGSKKGSRNRKEKGPIRYSCSLMVVRPPSHLHSAH